jgi:hypothetical protein
LTVTGIVFDPHGDEKVTVPSFILTPIVKLIVAEPETFLIPGNTRI